ncbi:Uma2 family endonuclease [Anthocerotibacter panamensis]|uniref:Uma2 family endonuclease n=1 Tax=Anthocerotibacter panamensis TaxID=2857077 RepID=UPI001C406715|nr:Uma2 family endonuclease [Anthocerotibacter panamensis]
MVKSNPLLQWPSSADLPDSDDTPVDNELQNLIPNLLLAVLARIWSERQDWFFGVDMGIYYQPGKFPQTPLVPDGFLSLGVTRRKSKRGRLSYVLWEEQNIVPKLVLEVVSQTYGGEYDEKLSKYARLGVLYYVVYKPDYVQRDQHEPFEVYQLVGERYERLPGEPVWLPEVGLGIGREEGTSGGWQREWLYWYDASGRRYLTPEECTEQERQRAEAERQRAEAERQRAEAERQRAEALAQRLRELGIEP